MPAAGPRAAVLFRQLAGRTVLDRILETLAGLTDLKPVIQARELTSGQNRLQAIRQALSGAPGSQRVLVCDPDRPLLTMGMLAHFLEATRNDPAATLVTPASDTHKEVRAGRVSRTFDRATLGELQGLSGFDRRTLERALISGQGSHELEACSEAGIPVRLVQGDPANFAVRSPEDLQVAELVLSQ